MHSTKLLFLFPVDMKTINKRIKGNIYKTIEDFAQDIRLMFNNCRQYNEDGSDIGKLNFQFEIFLLSSKAQTT